MATEAASYKSDESLGSDAIIASWCGGSCKRRLGGMDQWSGRRERWRGMDGGRTERLRCLSALLTLRPGRRAGPFQVLSQCDLSRIVLREYNGVRTSFEGLTCVC